MPCHRHHAGRSEPRPSPRPTASPGLGGWPSQRRRLSPPRLKRERERREISSSLSFLRFPPTPCFGGTGRSSGGRQPNLLIPIFSSSSSYCAVACASRRRALTPELTDSGASPTSCSLAGESRCVGLFGGGFRRCAGGLILRAETVNFSGRVRLFCHCRAGSGYDYCC